MPAEIFRGRMQNEIDAEIERSLKNRRPGIIANGKARRPRERSSSMAARSTIFSSGLEGVSIQASFVFGRSAFLTAARSLISTKSASSPQRRKISRSRRVVP